MTTARIRRTFPKGTPLLTDQQAAERAACSRVPQLSACPGDGLGRLRWWAVEQSL